MTLRQQSEADLAFVLEDNVTGFGWPITVTDPDELSAQLVGLSTDVAQTIDADTGQAITGRTASVVLRLASLKAAGLGTPSAVTDPKSEPWLVRFPDIAGTSHLFKVIEGNPDRALGVVVCLLESYSL